ncbi:MAG: hypothetical protein JNK50_14120 [Bacteroidia bacterium]|nr:hypothetical protein [Bacteroidia bacterium]
MYKYVFILTAIILIACRKDKGINPDLAYKDYSLLDSCKNEAAFNYYKNDPNIIYPGNNGAHGSFKLKFNKTAFAALTDNGKLPLNTKFPERSMVVKEVMSGTSLNFYAFMYKYKGAWIWGEAKPNGEVIYSVEKDPALCINCHQQTGNRDLVDTFIFY